MERDRSVRVRLDRLADEDASTLSWPPRDHGAAPDVVELETPQPGFAAGTPSVAPRGSSVREGEFPRPVSGAAGERPREARGDGGPRRPRPAWRLGRAAFVALAALALVEAIVIVLQLTGSGALGRIARTTGEPGGGRTADVAAATARTPDGSASSLDPSLVTQPWPSAAGTGGESGGQLQVQTDSARATVIVDGQPRGTAPLTVQGLAPGPHRVRLVAGDRSVEQTVVVQPDVATALVMPMGRGAAAGWVELVMPFEVQIVEEGRLVGTSAQSRLQFPAGEHRFELANDAVGYRAIQIVRVKPGEVAEVRPEVPTGLLSINAMPWAEVWIDGRQAGTTPLGNVQVPLGTREVRLRHPELGEETRRVLVTATEPARVSLDFRP